MNEDVESALSQTKSSWKEALREWARESLGWAWDVMKSTSKAIFNVLMSWIEKWSSLCFNYAGSKTYNPDKKQRMQEKAEKHNQKASDFFKRWWERAWEIPWWASRKVGWVILTAGYAGKAWWHLLQAWGYAWKEFFGNHVTKIKDRRKDKDVGWYDVSSDWLEEN